MKVIVFTLAFVIPALLLPAAERDRAALAEEFLSVQEAHRVGRVNDQWPKLRSDVVKYVAELYTEDELRGILAFYKTPAGQAFLTKIPKIQEQTAAEYLKVAGAHTSQTQNPGAASTPSPASAPKATPPRNSREFAKMLLDEIWLLDAAAGQWGIDNKKRKGEIPAPKDVLVYLKPGSRLRTSLEAGRCVDALGNPVKLAPFDNPPIISRLTVDQLSTVVPREFWGALKIE